jgi:7-alpha-hydroxysteroid dehydrogenase
MDEFSLRGRVAIVTGGSRGIGAEIARTFARAGAAVTVTSRTAGDVDTVAKEIEAAGGTALPYPTDVTDHDNLPGLVERTVNELGGLDIVVNNAGGGYEWSPFLDTTVEQLEASFHFTVATPFRLCQLAVPHLLGRPNAAIINIGSVTVGKAMRGHLAYEASKAAVTQLTKSMAADLGPRIRVNGIHPGVTETAFIREFLDNGPAELREAMINRTRLRRNGTPSDIANAAVYLASPAASWVTGTMLEVNGGPVDEFQGMFPDLVPGSESSSNNQEESIEVNK